MNIKPIQKSQKVSFSELTMTEALDLYRAPIKGTTKIQLMRPPRTMSRNYYSIVASPPIGIAYLGAVLEMSGYAVEIIDGHGEALDQWTTSDCGQFRYCGLSDEQVVSRIDPDTKILGVSLMYSQQWSRNRRIIDKIKERYPELIIVAGGEHPTALPRETLEQCPAINYIVNGEGEITFLALLHHLQESKSVKDLPGLTYLHGKEFISNGNSLRIRNINELPQPAWHLINVENYFRSEMKLADSTGRTMPILGTRGCPYQCTFCSNPMMWTTRYTMRDPVKVVDEMEWLVKQFKINSVDFMDLTAIVKKTWILDFCRELSIRKLNVTWNLPTGTRSEALDEETLKAIFEAGCTFLSYAPESGSERTLKAIKKKVKQENIIKSLQQAVAIGHHTRVFVILGFPHETRSDIFQTLAFMARTALTGINDINVFLFTPYPGSELFKELQEEGKIGKLDDAYFDSLFSQSDMTIRKSYCRALGWWELTTYRILGMMMFYILGYFRYPRRILRLARCILMRKFEPQNILERRIVDVARLLWKTKTR